MWADWYGFKMESYDGIKENIPFVHNAGACAIVHSDDANGIQRLNQEAAKALADGRRAGINISDEVAWTWLSSNPAKALGIVDKTGSLKPGKMADVVLWNGNPFSVYARPERVWIDGALMYDANNPQAPPGQRLRARPAGRRGRRSEAPRRSLRRPAARRARSPPLRRRADHRDHRRHGRARATASRADPGRHGRHPQRPDRRRRAGRARSRRRDQSIDATGKWVTPGIVAGFSRLGLAEVDLAADGTDDTSAQRPVQRRDRRRSGDQSAWPRPSPSTAPTG